MKRNNKDYEYPKIEELFINDDRNIQDKENEIKSNLVKIFKQLDKREENLKAINSQIREEVGIFKEPEESKDLKVMELLEKKESILDEYNDLISIAKSIIKMLHKEPVAVKTNFFINKFGNNTQKATDYINDILSKQNILSGTKELFLGLAFSGEAKSYSPLNLYYVEYKILDVFGIECELI